VVRRLIRLAYLREPLGDTSTVENPAALELRGAGVHACGGSPDPPGALAPKSAI